MKGKEYQFLTKRAKRTLDESLGLLLLLPYLILKGSGGLQSNSITKFADLSRLNDYPQKIITIEIFPE